MPKFKVGDKVRVTGNEEEYETSGLVGEIVDRYGYGDDGHWMEKVYWGILFNSKDFNEGHDLEGRVVGVSGLWVRESLLKPLNLVLENK